MNVLTDLFASAVQLYPGQMFPVLYIFYFSSLIPLRMAISLQCEPAEQSESGKALKGHIFKSKRVQDPYECLMFCYSELTCQYNAKHCEFSVALSDTSQQIKGVTFSLHPYVAA